MNDKVNRRHQMAERLSEVAGSLFPVKWMDLDSARIHVALYLLDRLIGPDTDDDDDAAVDVSLVMRHARDALIDAFASDVLPTRGIEHLSNAGPILHSPLPLIWWRRVVELGDRIDLEQFLGDDGDLPVHHLSWSNSQLIRALPREHEARLAVVTDIEVNATRLYEIAHRVEKPSASTDAARRLFEKSVGPGRKPDLERIVAVQKIAKDIVQQKFGTLAAFNNQVVEQYGQEDPNGLDPKQVGRWIFGEK